MRNPPTEEELIIRGMARSVDILLAAGFQESASVLLEAIREKMIEAARKRSMG